MAPKVPVSLRSVEETMALYANTKRLVAHDHAITPEERVLMEHFKEVVKLVLKTDYSRRFATAELDGYGDTPHQERVRREFEERLARLETKHDNWISSLEPVKARLVVPFGSHYVVASKTACECQSQTA